MAAEIYLPKMSDHMEEGTIIRWLVKEGETVARGQVLLEIETDKAIGEIEAPADGVLKGVRAGDGVTIPVGETIAYVARADEVVPVKPPLGAAPAGGEQAAATQPPAETTESAQVSVNGLTPATPVARRVAKDLGVDIRRVKGTGPGGRVKEEDVRAYAAAQAAKPVEAPLPATHAAAPALAQATAPAPQPLPIAQASQASGALPLTHIQRITGQRMQESVQQAPHFYLQVSANMSAAQRLIDTARERIEAETGARLSVTAVLVKAAALALKKFPRANSSFQNGSLQHYNDVNIGVAVGAEDGLVVPVIRNADRKSLAEVAQELKNFQAKASEMRFSPEDLASGTFTISNLGMYGVDVFTAIINPPQSSILAVGRIKNTPVGMDDGSFALQPLMAMTLSVDHRCMDGLQGAKFLAEIKELLEEPYLML